MVSRSDSARSGNSLVVHVGPWEYRVKVARGGLRDKSGNLLNGKAVSERREILLAVDLVGEQREETLLHEIAHCYEFHFPAPKTTEELADLVATIAKQVERDLGSDGLAAVHSLWKRGSTREKKQRMELVA